MASRMLVHLCMSSYVHCRVCQRCSQTRDVKVSRPTWSRDHFFGLGLGLGLTVIGLGLGLGLMR